MLTFRIKPNGYSEISSKLLLRVSLQLLIIFPVALLIPFAFLIQTVDLEVVKEMLSITGPFTFILLIVGLYLAHRTFKKQFEGTILTVTDTTISLAQPQLPILTMNFDFLTVILKMTDIFEKLPDFYNYFWSHIGQGM